MWVAALLSAPTFMLGSSRVLCRGTSDAAWEIVVLRDGFESMFMMRESACNLEAWDNALAVCEG